MASTIKLKNGSGAPLASDLVQGEPAFDLTNKRLYTENASGTVIEVGTNPAAEITANGGIALPDNQKATFGAGDDLQIYHDGTSSIIQENGAGALYLQGSHLYLNNAAGSSNYLSAIDGGAVTLYSNGSAKLATTATGINVTGTVTADGLTVDGQAVVSRTNNTDHLVVKNDQNGNVATPQYSDVTFRGYNSQNKARIRGVDRSGNLLRGGLTIQTQNSSQVLTDRIFIDGDGDISFYEDTGTTAKFFWDASAEALGIGTTSPSSTYGIDSTKGIRVIGTSPNFTMQESDASNQQWQLGSFAGDFAIRNITASTYPVTVDTSGNVGIGETAPNNNVHVTTSTNGGGLTIQRDSITSGDYGQLGFNQTVNSAGTPNLWIRGYRGATFETSYMTFGTGGATGSERMRIDASGNLLVGKTTVNSATTVGLELQSDGQLFSIVDGRAAGTFIRKTSDGSIVDFRKDSTTVGSIGADGGDLFIGTGDTGIRFSDSGNAIVAQNPSTVADSDAFVDLGTSGIRFKDLYLSGGVYLGGTGAANHLDDYEEGTFTPTLTFGGADTGNVYGSQTGRYTKIGNVVHVDVYVRLTTLGSATNNAEISGLPFTVNSGNESGGSVGYFLNLTGLTSTPIVRPTPSGTTLELRDTTASDAVRITHSNFTATSDIRLSVRYRV